MYIFERNADSTNGWGEVKKLIASDAYTSDEFGGSVAVAGDVVVVGAEHENTGGSQAGAVYVFERNAGGINGWGEEKKLMPSDAQAGNYFGNSVAVAGDVIVVGAPYEDGSGYSAGAVYIF